MPDLLLIPALMEPDCKTTWADMTEADRAWACAGMRRAGMTAQQMADRLRCALRTVRSMLAEPICAVCWLLQEESEHFADELRMTRDELRRETLDRIAASHAAERYKGQLINLLDAHLLEGPVGIFPCGCPMTTYNTYTAPKTKKRGCRRHRGMAVQRCRERQRAEAGVIDGSV